MPNDYGRLHRLLKVLIHIQGDTGWNVKRLMSNAAKSAKHAAIKRIEM